MSRKPIHDLHSPNPYRKWGGTPGVPMVYNPPQLDRTFSDELASRLAREYTKECVESLVEHMRDRANPTTSLVATNALLDRAYGKPKEIKMLSGDGGEKTPAYRIKIEFVDTIDASPKMKSPDVAPQPVFEEN